MSLGVAERWRGPGLRSPPRIRRCGYSRVLSLPVTAHVRAPHVRAQICKNKYHGTHLLLGLLA